MNLFTWNGRFEHSFLVVGVIFRLLNIHYIRIW